MKQTPEILELQKELRQNLEALRRDFQEIVEKYKINIEAELVHCIELLSEHESDDVPAGVTDPKQLEFINQTLNSLTYKTKKGRMKDLRKIHYFIKLLAARFFH